jgi:hypothetical protein
MDVMQFVLDGAGGLEKWASCDLARPHRFGVRYLGRGSWPNSVYHKREEKEKGLSSNMTILRILSNTFLGGLQ